MAATREAISEASFHYVFWLDGDRYLDPTVFVKKGQVPVFEGNVPCFEDTFEGLGMLSKCFGVKLQGFSSTAGVGMGS